MREYNTKHQIIQKKTVKKLGNCNINIDFNGGDISSDGGLFMISEIDRKIDLTAPIAEILDKHDPRYEPMVTHSNLRMLRQRINGIVSGYEDITDHDHIRHDLNHQVAADTDEALASSPTLCRMENNQGGNRKVCLRMMEQIVENFIRSFSAAPQELILDFNATDDPVHGEQLGRYFHGYYDRYCFLPLYVFCGERLLVSYLRPSSRKADTWDRKRHVIVKAEHTEKGPNTRYVLTNLEGTPRHLYEKVYCARGNMENRIKEQQLYLFADRTSCHAWWANQFRLLLSSLAYILVEKLRRSYLKGTRFAHAQAVTIREKLIKIGAVIVQKTRTIYLHLSSTYPYKAIFSKVVDSLAPG